VPRAGPPPFGRTDFQEERMPSIERPLSGPVLTFRLEEERAHVTDPAILGRSGRNARTLIKEGPLRVTLVVLGPGGSIPAHRADGPITVQPLEGRLRFWVGDEEHELGPGDILSAAAGVEHSVASEAGATFLLTIALALRARP